MSSPSGPAPPVQVFRPGLTGGCSNAVSAPPQTPRGRHSSLLAEEETVPEDKQPPKVWKAATLTGALALVTLEVRARNGGLCLPLQMANVPFPRPCPVSRLTALLVSDRS